MGWGDALGALVSGDFAGAAAQAGAAFAGSDQSPEVVSDGQDNSVDDSGGGYTQAGFQVNVGGPSGFTAQAGDLAAPNVGIMPMPRPVGPISGGGGFHDTAQAIVSAIGDAIGRSISAKQVVRFILKYGWQVASAAFQQPPQNLVIIVADQKAKPHRRRGPHLFTVLKRIKAGKRYEKMLSRYAHKAHVGGGHRRSAAPARGRVIVVPAQRKK